MEKGKLYILMDELLEAKECADAMEYATEWLLKAFREQSCAEGINIACLYNRQLKSLVADLQKCLQTLDEGIVNLK